MDAVLAQTLAREAVKKKPTLARVEIEEKTVVPTEREPERLALLKKAEVEERPGPAPVNATPMPKVQLKRAQPNERPNIEVNSAPLPKIELKKAEIKERPNIEVNQDNTSIIGAKVQLKKAEVKERPTAVEVNKDVGMVRVQLKKADVKERRQNIEVNTSSLLPTVQLRHREIETKKAHPNDSNDQEQVPKPMVELRKPGKGRFRNLEQYYQD
jgi:hypothetical protein